MYASGAQFLAFSPLFTLSRRSFLQIGGSLVLLEFSIIRHLETISTRDFTWKEMSPGDNLGVAWEEKEQSQEDPELMLG